MNDFKVTPTQSPTNLLLVLLASSVLLTAGCANMATTAVSGNSLGVGASVTGKLHGGNQPVAFATVTLNFAGQSRLATAASVAATTQTLDDNAGSFSFTKDPINGTSYPNTGNTFSCPGDSSDPLVYVVAKGGNTLNTHDNSVNNTAAVFIAPLGLCSQIGAGNFVDM
jgi:hypothetical protein